MSSNRFLDAHLNVSWLRPESALCDAIASSVISQFPFKSPSLDLGSGNGIFSFITAGGAFSLDFDWYRNVAPKGFWNNEDIYDCLVALPSRRSVVEEPVYRIDCALDAKRNLLRQAQALNFYNYSVLANANRSLPFQDDSFETIFSNMLCWLDSAQSSLQEIRRVLRPGGYGLFCLQDHVFKDYCISYRWRELNSEVLRRLNRGRSESSLWTTSYDDITNLARNGGFKIISHTYYLSPLTLKAWDIGLRPLSPVLIRMVGKLTEADRLSIKAEWVEILRPFLAELYEFDKKSNERGGFHFVCLQKT